MGRWKFLAAFVAAVLIVTALPLSAQTSKSGYLSGSDHVCKATLADGTPYEVWDRVLLKEWEGQPLYVKVRAYYRPGSGEIFWRSTGYSKTGYANALKESPKKAGMSCEEPYRHIVVLQDGEWADFWAERGRVVVSHCNLKFSSREKAWVYIEQHWQEGADDPGPSTKWVSEILLYDQLGREFFRPKKLEFDARPYMYDSLISVKKVGANWELEIKGADEPNRATVLLDREFRVIKATRNGPAR
jgi:hypothetical protein